MNSPLRHRRLGAIARPSSPSPQASAGLRRSRSSIVGIKARSLVLHLVLLAVAVIAPLHAGAWYVGNTQNGEWVQYNKVWFAAGTYRFVARVGSPVSTAKVHMEVDGTTLMAAIAVPNTGRVDKFGYVYLGSKTLTAGIHDLRVAFETADVSLDWFMAVKDTDPTTSVKASDKTMIYPPATGLLLAPIVAFHASDSDGHAASLLDLGNPIKDANGNAFTDAQAQAWWSVPMYRDWDRRTDRYWDIIVDHLTALRAQVPYFYCKGTVDFTDGLQDREFQIGGGSFEGRWMQKFAEAVARNPQAASSLKIGMIWDQGGLGDDFAKVYGYNPGFATPALVDYAIQYYLGPWFDNIPASMLLQPVAGRPIIRMMSTSPSGVIKDGQISVFLQELRKRLLAKYGIDPLFIIQSDGTLDAATQAQVWGRVKGLNWSGPLATETRFNGSDWMGMSCGSRHGLDQVWLNDWNPVTNTGTPGGNSAGVDAFQSRLNAAGASVLFNNLDRAQIGAYGAVGYDTVSGGPTKQNCDEAGLNLTNITNGSYTSYNGAGGWDLTGVTGFKARVASAATGGNIEIRMDSPTGTLLGTCAVPVTGGAQTWATQTCTLTGASGKHNIYLVYTGGAGNLFNFEWFAFTGGTTGTTVVEDEGLTNIAEGNAFLRSYHQGWQFPNQHLAAMRQYADPTTQTLMFEAEACDSYNKLTLAGNKGGTYRKQWYSATDLDVYRPLHNTQAWITQSTGPGNLVSIAAGFFDVWALDSAGAIWGHRISGDPDVWTKVTSAAPAALSVVSVGKFYAWGITTAGAVYSTHLEYPAPNYQNQGWTLRTGTMAHLDVGDAEVWGTDSSGNVFRRPLDGSGSWTAVTGQLLDKVWVGDAHVWGIRSGTLYHAYLPTQPSSVPITFTAVSNPNSLTKLDVGSDEVWGVNAAGNVYRMSAAGVGSWDAVTGVTLTNVSVGEIYAWGLNGSTPYRCELEGFLLSEAPIPPFGIRSAAGSGQTTLSWIPTTGATSYTIKRSTTNGGPYTNIGTSTNPSFLSTGLSNGTTYYYVIEAVTAAGNSGNSTQITVAPAAAPGAPSALAATAPSLGEVDLTWTDNATNEAGFVIERRRGPNGAYELLKRIDVPNTASYSDTTVATGVAYTYRVRTWNSNLTESSNSNEASVTSTGGNTIYINFQPASATPVPGYLADTGKVYGDRSLDNLGGNLGGYYSYGWSVDSTGQTRDRGLTASQLLDTILLWKAGATWEIGVPNGTYDVKVGIGDGQDTTTSSLNVEGVNYWSSQAMTPGLFLNATHSITITDGKITMDQGAGATNATRVDFVEITPTFSSSAPTGLTITPGNAQVTLNWTAKAGATGYHIRRSTSATGNYTQVGTATGTTYTDNVGLKNGVFYYYTVSADVTGGETAAGTAVGTMPGTYSSPWTAQSIGGSPGDGGNLVNNMRFTIFARGSDIYNTSDQFRYIYQTATGDCSIQAYVTGMQAADQWTKVGVMIRETLAADAANVSALVSATNGVSLQYRSAASGTTTQVTTSGLFAPYWVKVTRVGNAFSAYRSTDGTNWTQLGTTQTITMSSSVYIGLAATSHNSSVWAQGSVSNVTAVP